MNILIVGGFGYLGQRLGKHLHDAGFNITLASREQRDSPKWLENGSTLKINWNDTKSFFPKPSQIDAVIHAAGMNALNCSKYPILAKEFNGDATGRLVKESVKNHISQFIYLSTAHVYANPLEGVISEDNQLLNTHPYATSHAIGESHVIAANSSGDIKGKVLRLSNCFGSPVNKTSDCWGLLVNDICMQAIKLNHITLKTSGSQSRDFIPISTFCKMVCNLLDDDSLNLEKPIFNIGGRTMTILEMTNLVRDVYFKKFQKKISLSKEKDLNSEVLDKLQYNMNWYQEEDVFNENEANAIKEIEDLLDFCKICH